MERIKEILEFTLIESKYLTINLVDVLFVFLVLVFSRFSVYLIHRILHRRVNKEQIDQGKAYAIGQMAKYFIYIIAIIIALDTIGVKITVLLAGSTALFVGLGLGLQDIFKDLSSGIVVLTERTIKAHDIVEIDGTVGEVIEIGLRTTKLRTRDDIELIIPNQRLTAHHVINWSSSGKKTRFNVEVGVAYGSDTELVKKVLIEVAKNHNAVNNSPTPEVFFSGFGNSSLDFKLLFFSNNLFRIERVKSELRFAIDKAFRENGITIAFPQLDVWFKNGPQAKQE